MCGPGCPGTHSVDQAGLELTEIHLPLPPECWDLRHVPPPFCSPGAKDETQGLVHGK